MLNEIPNSNNLVDELTHQLREAIISGIYPPETLFNQGELADEFNVSRTPIREALIRLEYEGFVEVGKKRQFKVKNIDFHNLSQIYQMREVIDGVGARILAEQITSGKGEEVIGELERILDSMNLVIQSWDYLEWSRLNVSFHATIIKASSNEMLINQLPLLRISGEMFYPALMTNPKRAKVALDEHYMILRAINSGNGDLAENIARVHIRMARQIVDKLYLSNAQSKDINQK